MTQKKKAKKLCILSLLLTLFAFIQPVQAQTEIDTTATYRVQTNDGNEYIGQIIHQDEEHILLKTRTIGEITIARINITRLTRISPEQIVNGQIWADNPQATRYFWAPNGYGLKKGEGYYQNIWVFFNQGSIGITDNISMGVGTVPLFLFAGTSTPVWLTPKVSVPIVENKFNLGAGALLGSVVGEEGAGFGLLYGVGTVGSRNHNATLGLGYGYAGREWSTTPVVTIGGMSRVGKNWYLLTENYIIRANNDTFALLMFGSRAIIRRVGLDFGLIFPYTVDVDEFYAFPWLGFSIPFDVNGSKR